MRTIAVVDLTACTHEQLRDELCARSRALVKVVVGEQFLSVQGLYEDALVPKGLPPDDVPAAALDAVRTAFRREVDAVSEILDRVDQLARRSAPAVERRAA